MILSFTRFLRLGIEDSIPDATTVWLFREKLAKAGLIEKLFDRFDQYLAAKGYMARGGQMVDATIVPVPKQRNSGDENEAVKAGRIPEEWGNKPAKLRQKDRDARWTKKHGKSFFGYKNHVNADAKHKLIRRYEVTDAAVHDSQKLDGLLTKATRRRRCSPAVFISAPLATTRCRTRKRKRTATGVKFAPASNMYSGCRMRVASARSVWKAAPSGQKAVRSRQITLENTYRSALVANNAAKIGIVRGALDSISS